MVMTATVVEDTVITLAMGKQYCDRSCRGVNCYMKVKENVQKSTRKKDFF
jgi:hypothetical protein